MTGPNTLDPRITAKYVTDGLADFGGAVRQVVADEKFPPIVSLARDAAQAAFEQDCIPIGRPKNDRDQRTIPEHHSLGAMVSPSHRIDRADVTNVVVVTLRFDLGKPAVQRLKRSEVKLA